MNMTTPILAGAAYLAALPGDSVASLLGMIGEPKAVLSTISETQFAFPPDRNQKLAQLSVTFDPSDGRSVLRGSVTLDYHTTNRLVILTLPGQARCEFRLRLPPNPTRFDL